MPSNLYGVANAPGGPFVATTIGGTNISCPAGTETPVVQSPALSGGSQGYFYCIVFGTLCVTMNATPATALVWAIKFSGGSDIQAVTVPSQLLTANNGFFIPILLTTAGATVPWVSPGTVVQVTLNPTTQAVNAIQVCTNINFALFRAPDQ